MDLFGLRGIKLYALLIGFVGALIFVGWAFRVDALRGECRSDYNGLTNEVSVVLPAVRDASGNPKLQWRPGKGDEVAVAEQVRILGNAKQSWQQTATDQSQRIAELGAETAKLRQLNEQARRQAEVLIAQRNSALNRLEQQALTPGERQFCEAQLKSAEEALDTVYAEGL